MSFIVGLLVAAGVAVKVALAVLVLYVIGRVADADLSAAIEIVWVVGLIYAGGAGLVAGVAVWAMYD